MDFLKKKGFLQKLQGCAHIMLRFPAKSEIGRNFRVHSAGLVSVICRKMVLCGPICSGRGNDGAVTDYQTKPKKHTQIKQQKKKRDYQSTEKPPKK